eukprot:scaffold132491_cov31-Tisochrysis_lutea.AAC.3
MSASSSPEVIELRALKGELLPHDDAEGQAKGAHDRDPVHAPRDGFSRKKLKALLAERLEPGISDPAELPSLWVKKRCIEAAQPRPNWPCVVDLHEHLHIEPCLCRLGESNVDDRERGCVKEGLNEHRRQKEKQ